GTPSPDPHHPSFIAPSALESIKVGAPSHRGVALVPANPDGGARAGRFDAIDQRPHLAAFHVIASTWIRPYTTSRCDTPGSRVSNTSGYSWSNSSAFGLCFSFHCSTWIGAVAEMSRYCSKVHRFSESRLPTTAAAFSSPSY